MPEYITELTDQDRKRLERLGINLGYKIDKQLANTVLKDIVSGRLKVTKPTLIEQIVRFFKGANW